MTATALLAIAAAIAYLPGLLQAGIYRDDWYYVLDRLIGGPGIFQAMFSIDRPARGPFFELYYQLFGIAPLPYHLASFAWRLLSGVAALWLFRLLWPSHPRATMWMALLFMLFPGYLRWMEGFEDQPHAASAFLEALSIALTIKAISTRRRTAQLASWAGSIATGWAYLALLDFAIGMEVFRLLCVLVALNRADQGRRFINQIKASLRAWAIAAAVPVGFLFWRLFIFHDIRQQTDVGRQLGAVLVSPLATLTSWAVSWVQSAADVGVFGWVTPALQQSFGLRPRLLLQGGFLAGLIAVCVLVAIRLMGQPHDEQSAPGAEREDRAPEQAAWIGALGVIAGVLPVVLANRHADFYSYSHYALPASLASATFLIGIVTQISSRKVQAGVITFLACCAVAAHFTYSMQVVDEERVINAFWQQVAWRAPALQAGSTIYVNYPGIDYADNFDAAGGPANLIYFPTATGEIPVTYQISALRQEPTTTQDVLIGKDHDVSYRTHLAIERFDQLLVLSQPTRSSCVHLIDARSPIFSTADPDQVRVIGLYSDAGQVTGRQGNARPDPAIFGPEPPHGWCYYFEKADLARQYGDWQEVSRLGASAAAASLHPEDAVEWVPFLQAYAALGDASGFSSTARRLGLDAYAWIQACSTLKGMQSAGTVLPAPIKSQVDTLLCRGR